MTIKPIISNNFEVRLLATKEELDEVQRLRYQEIILEYNKNSINESGKDESIYDEHCDHIIAIDNDKKMIIGTYRMMKKEHVKDLGGFISEEEYDISKLINSPYNILELGRVVIHKDYRGGIILKLIWRFVLEYVKYHQIRFIFGTASYHGTDPSLYKDSLSILHYRHLIDNEYCPKAIGETSGPLDFLEEEKIDERAAISQTPALIKGYLALGARIGEGYFRDIPFNSVDVFVLIDMMRLNGAYVKRLFN